MEPQVIHEEPEWAAVLKPAGLQMHHARIASGAHPRTATLADWILTQYPETAAVGDAPGERPGMVHRLDKDTSGLVLIARTQGAFSYLKNIFQERKITKTYLALARGHLKSDTGVIDRPIGILSGSTKRSVRSDKMAKSAVTEYAVEERLTRTEPEEFISTLLRVSPRTGRTHQIRVHLNFLGHPILGDRLYGPKNQPSWAVRLMLHAYALELEVSPGKRMRLEAEPDEAFKNVYLEAGGRPGKSW